MVTSIDNQGVQFIMHRLSELRSVQLEISSNCQAGCQECARWKSFGGRHKPAVKKNCEEGDLQCRRRQRQALLQWAYNPIF